MCVEDWTKSEFTATCPAIDFPKVLSQLSERDGQPSWSRKKKQEWYVDSHAAQNVQLDAEPYPIC